MDANLCKTCGSLMKPLFTGSYCPCDGKDRAYKSGSVPAELTFTLDATKGDGWWYTVDLWGAERYAGYAHWACKDMATAEALGKRVWKGKAIVVTHPPVDTPRRDTDAIGNVYYRGRFKLV